MSEALELVEEQAPTGRPPKYKAEFAKQAEKLCILGATDADLADFFGVSVRTVERWKVEHAPFCRAVKIAKDIADDRVERSLYQRAVGYETDAVKIMQYEGVPVIVPYREKVQADTTAAIFWLKNRRKDQWRDKSEVDLTHKVTLAQEFEDFIRSLNGGSAAKVIEHVSDIADIGNEIPASVADTRPETR